MGWFGDEGPGDMPIESSFLKSSSTNASIIELQQAVERQNLLIQTLCKILVAKGLVLEDELNEWMRYVDGLDGNVDGRLRDKKAPLACPSCKRMNPSKAAKCQYCGTELQGQFLYPEE